MRKVTIKDIAILAKVSISTVSFVLNNKGPQMAISDLRIKKVKEIAKDLGYIPNMIASSLRTGTTKSIGLIIEDISNQFFSELAKVIEDQARNLGYKIFYCSTNNDDDRTNELIQSLLQANVDGFIITPTAGSEKNIDHIIKLNKPVVLIDRYFPHKNISYVVMDNYEGATKATELLISNGFKNIALVNNTSGMIQMRLREKGYHDILKKEGIYREKLVLHLPFQSTEEERKEELISFFLQNPEIDAVLFSANYMALAGLQAFKQMKYELPKDISIISFDDHASFRLHTPTISVVEQPIESLATKVVETLMKQINNKKEYKPEKIMQKGNLIIRESVVLQPLEASFSTH